MFNFLTKELKIYFNKHTFGKIFDVVNTDKFNKLYYHIIFMNSTFVSSVHFSEL
jgi:hypothetical protein